MFFIWCSAIYNLDDYSGQNMSVSAGKDSSINKQRAYYFIKIINFHHNIRMQFQPWEILFFVFMSLIDESKDSGPKDAPTKRRISIENAKVRENPMARKIFKLQFCFLN